MGLNMQWEQRIKEKGADFVYFVDASALPWENPGGYRCAVLFGKALTKEYVNDMRASREPKSKEVFNTERKMDALALKVAEWLEAEGFRSIGKLKTGVLPHKTVALRAGLGFIGKNNLLITSQYGCALMLGKVLNDAPFEVMCATPMEPRCGDCRICADVCPGNALLGTTWSVTKKREDIIDRKLCSLCLRCMVCCPYTIAYAESDR